MDLDPELCACVWSPGGRGAFDDDAGVVQISGGGAGSASVYVGERCRQETMWV